MRGSTPLRLISLAWIGLLAGCSGAVTRAIPIDFGGGPTELEGFAACSDSQPDRLDLTSDEPLVVIVHGCFASGSQFRAMSRLFEFNGQRTVCFNYDDRHSLRHTARTLRRGLDAIHAASPRRGLTVFGHSQGGLISRIAVSEVDGVEGAKDEVQLVTVSSPFSGIATAEHCGLIWLHILSFGLTPAICQAITGYKWTEIPPSARLWQDPRPLQRLVGSHLQIVTDEVGTCRRRAENGDCEEDDSVFSLAEQLNATVAEDERVRTVTVALGHAEVTGSDGSVPRRLIRLLQEEGVLGTPPPRRQLAFERLILASF